MNVSQENTSKVSALIKIDIVKADYEEKVEKALRTYRQKANIPGFRKGMAPMGMIKKMVGKSILLEEINKLVSESLYNYIKDNKMNILGEPLPSESQAEIDFDKQEDFTFLFDVALAPEIDITLTDKDKIDYYHIDIDDDMVAKQKEALCSRFGVQQPVEEASEKDIVKGQFVELDENNAPKEGGISVESLLTPAYLKDEAEKNKFVGKKVGDKVVFNPSVACGENDTEIAAMLHIGKDKSADVKSNFEVEITSILGFKPAEVGQELYDNAFGKDTVKSEEEFTAKIREMLASQLQPESDYKFALDARTALEAKVGEVELPDNLLKRWLVVTGENRTAESVEEEYPKMVPDLKWQLIKEEIVKKYEIKVDDADMLEMAKKATRAQFAQYGMANVPDDLLEKYASDMLKDKKIVSNIAERATEEKIIETIKSHVSLNEKNISVEDFYKMFESK
ncbi:MAG TPA: trigger factor [Candidatus Caccoplasma merdavium]|nr:trigger factor [Candidatus Caccoplasma merdavium]